MNSIKVLFVVAVLAGNGCARPGSLDLDHLSVAERGKHFDLVASGVGACETLAWADEAYDMFSELLKVHPPRAKLVVLPDRQAFNRAVEPHGQGTDGLYRPIPSPIIVTFPHQSPRVIRHEVAHHFIRELIGDVPAWMGEGLAEILEGVRRVAGVPIAPIVDVWHLDRFADHGCVAPLPPPGQALHVHVDYTAAWAITAHLLSREQGTLRAKILALRRFVDTPPTSLMPEPDDLLEEARAWLGEIASQLESPEHSDRAAAARVLGKLGESGPLRRSLEQPQPLWVAAAIAGSLARNGEFDALRALVPEICCENLLHQISLAVGREFRTTEDLKNWLSSR